MQHYIQLGNPQAAYCPAAEQREVTAVRSGDEWLDTSGNVIQVRDVLYANLTLPGYLSACTD